MRSRYLLSYDISDQKRWRQVYRTLRGYGDPLHYSVFQCVLSASERVLMLDALERAINLREDRILIVCLGPATSASRHPLETLGRPLETPNLERVVVIVE